MDRRTTKTTPGASAHASTTQPPMLTAADLADLRVQLEDILSAALDATDRPSKRKLGRNEARRQILEAAEKCRAILAPSGRM